METPAKIYDVGIIGAGAAGLTASIYASRYQLSNIVFGTLWGGEIANASVIENWPGDRSVTGAELTKRMVDHARHLNAEIRPDRIIKVIKNGRHNFDLVTEAGDKVAVKEVILSTGTRRRHLNIPGEDKLAGRGVSYCATCDAPFFREKITAVIGGGDAAMTAALHVALFSPEVYLVVRRDDLGGEPIWREKVRANPKIKILFQTEVTEILGDQTVTGIKLSRPYGGQDSLSLSGVFVEIGADPDVVLAEDLGVELDSAGYIKVSEEMRTNLDCVYASGDATTGNAHLDQIISAAAEGGLAARSIFWHLTQEKSKPGFLKRLLS